MTRIPLFIATGLCLVSAIGATAQERPITNQAERQKILTAARERYFDVRKAVGQGLMATVRATPATEKKAGDSLIDLEARVYAIVDSMRFTLTLPGDGEDPTLMPDGASVNPSAGVQRAIDGLEELVPTAFQVWLKLRDEIGFPPSDSGCKIFKEPKGYAFAFTSDGNEVRTNTTEDYTITDITVMQGRDKFRIVPSFTPSNQGLLLQQVAMKLGADADIEMKYEDAEINGTHLPVRLVINALQPHNSLTIHIAIANYRPAQ